MLVIFRGQKRLNEQMKTQALRYYYVFGFFQPGTVNAVPVNGYWLPYANLAHLLQFQRSGKYFLYPILFQGHHTVLYGLAPDHINFGPVLDQQFNLIGSHQQFVQGHPAAIALSLIHI